MAAGAVREPLDQTLFYEVIVWIVIALALYLFISMLGYGGAVGRTAARFLFGLFGIMAYLFPFVLFIQVAFLVSNKKSRVVRIMTAGSAGVFVTLCGIIQLILVGYNPGYILSEYYQAGAAYHIGGGLVGGALTSFFASGIGIVGTFLVYLIMMIIRLILMTQRSALAGVRKGGTSVLNKARRGKEVSLSRLLETRMSIEGEVVR